MVESLGSGRRVGYRVAASALALLALASAARADVATDEDGLPSLDPFRCLVEVVPPTRVLPPKPFEAAPPAPAPAPPPLVLELRMLVEVPDQRLAVVAYKGAEYLVGRGWSGGGDDGFDGRFSVVSVDEGKVVVHDRLTQEEREFSF